MKFYNIALIGCGQMGAAHLDDIYFKENVTDNIFATLHFGLFDMVEGSKIYIKRQ